MTTLVCYAQFFFVADIGVPVFAIDIYDGTCICNLACIDGLNSSVDWMPNSN